MAAAVGMIGATELYFRALEMTVAAGCLHHRRRRCRMVGHGRRVTRAPVETVIKGPRTGCPIERNRGHPFRADCMPKSARALRWPANIRTETLPRDETKFWDVAA